MMRASLPLLLLLSYATCNTARALAAAGAMQERNIDTMLQALQYFKPYSSPIISSISARPSATYMVMTGSVNAHKAELLWSTWGRTLSAPDRIYFTGDKEMNTEVKQHQFSFIEASRMIPLQYSSGRVRYGGHDVARMKPHRRSQLKWLDSILHFGSLAARTGNSDSTDWFVFVDDDTLILPVALTALLSEFDRDSSILIGKGGKECHKMCGGAGFAISKPLLIHLFQAREALVEAFFTGYPILGRPPQLHSDVVLSHFILSRHISAEFMRRQEFKNFSPMVAAKWVAARGEGLGRTVSFHKIGSAAEYREVFEYFSGLSYDTNTNNNKSLLSL